jgi:hypothetical protein
VDPLHGNRYHQIRRVCLHLCIKDCPAPTIAKPSKPFSIPNPIDSVVWNGDWSHILLTQDPSTPSTMAALVATASPPRPQSLHQTTGEPSTPSALQLPAASLSSLPTHAARDFMWTPSKSEALGPAAVKLTKREPRLWDRAPQVPAAQDSRFKTVWKRYMLRPRGLTSAPALPSSDPAPPALLGGQEKTPERPVKKMRVRHDLFAANQAVVTKWQRRRSSLPSKTLPIDREGDLTQCRKGVKNFARR